VFLCGPWSPLPGWLSTTLTVIAVVPLCALLLQLILVKVAAAVVEKFDKDYLGVDVDIGYLSFNAFKGRLQVQDVTITNPPGYPGPFMLKIDNFVLDLDMRRTCLSLGKAVEVDELTGQGITAHLEFDGLLYGKSNVTTVLDTLKAAQKQNKGDIQPVYSFWHPSNGEHTFHFDPAWGGEDKLGCQFYAHKTQAEGTQPVYGFWNSWYREHTFRLGDDAECSLLDWRGDVQFYAFPKEAPHAEPVHEFWHVGNKEHTLHFMPAWDREEAGPVRFYAYRRDPTGNSKGDELKAVLKPVYDFWHRGQKQHQFHFLPAWGGERKGKIHFYALSKKEKGTVAVCDFYNKEKNKKTFHTGDPRPGEEKYSQLFWVHPTPVSGTEPVYEFWHEGNQEYNIHMGNPWPGEEKKEVMFYAYREDPSADRRVFVRKVQLQKIKANSSTRMLGASVSLDDLTYDDFSTEFEAVTPSAIVENMLNLVFSKVSIRIW